MKKNKALGQKAWRRIRFSGMLLRELIGWGLVVGGLNAFRITFGYLETREVTQGFIAALVGFFLLRTGVQFIRLAVASRAFAREEIPSPLHEN